MDIVRSSQSVIITGRNMPSHTQNGGACEDSKYLSERFGARQMQIYSNGGPGTPFGGLVNQFEPFTYALFPGVFPLLFFWQIHDAFMGAHRKRLSDRTFETDTLFQSRSLCQAKRFGNDTGFCRVWTPSIMTRVAHSGWQVASARRLGTPCSLTYCPWALMAGPNPQRGICLCKQLPALSRT